MSEYELLRSILKRAHRDDAKAFKAYMMTQWRTFWAEEAMDKYLEKERAVKGIERGFKAMQVKEVGAFDFTQL